jgi:hypothetical protein
MPIDQMESVSQPQAMIMLSIIDARMGISYQMIGRATRTLHIAHYLKCPTAQFPFKVDGTDLLV